MRNEGHGGSVGPAVSSHGLDKHGITGIGTAHWNLTPAELYEHALRRGEARLGAEGSLVCETGPHTGRSPNDKFTVSHADTDGDIWWGEVNRALDRAKFEA